MSACFDVQFLYECLCGNNSLFYSICGSFYFGAIRETDRSVTPEIKVFNDCVAFFPYFDDKGTFGCYVFMNGKPTTLDDFLLYYSKDFVYLTRVRSTDRFYPN